MGIYVNQGKENFERAVRSKIYIDKTGMLEYLNSVIDTEQGCLCVSRPRRFGKSVTASMIAAYYEKGINSHDLFNNYKIAQTADYDKYMNQYDVIHVDMNTFRHKRNATTGVQVTALESVELLQTEIIQELRALYGEWVTEQDIDLPEVLAKIHNGCGTRFVIIIDEWDTIFREDKDDEIAQKAYVNLLRCLFKNAPSKSYLALAYITGILPIKKYGTESALNNFDEFTIMNPRVLAEYVGFTEDEVKALCDEYSMDFNEAARWYDGYSFRRVKHIYNPNSVVKAMLNEEFDNYWSKTESFESLKNYISMNFDGLQEAIVAMLAGERCKVNTDTFENDMTSFESRDEVLTVLIHLGYLAYDCISKEVYIPNEEVRSSFANAIHKSSWKHVSDAIRRSDVLLKATWNKDTEAVAEGIEKVHDANSSILNYNDENSLSCAITLAYYNAINEYTLIRELPTGKGFADIVFLPRKYSDKPAMIVELKWDKDANGAISQIRDKQYMKALEEYRGNLLLVGINYSKKR